jgi:hypothetical protein
MSFIRDRVDELYEEWLLKEYPDEIKNKDDLIEIHQLQQYLPLLLC